MRNLISLSLVLSLVAVVSLSACTRSENKSESPRPQVQTTFVNGSPMEILEGARLDRQSPFTARNIETFADYGLVALQIFQEREEKAKENKSDKEVETENAPPEKPRSELYQHYRDISVARHGSDSWLVGMRQDSLKFLMTSDESGSLQPTQLRTAGGGIPVELLHWSQSSDKQMLSVLVRARDEEVGEALLVAYFARKSKTVEYRRIDTRFLTIEGPGYAVRWEAPQLNIGVCGASSLLTDARAAAAQWQQALGNRLQLNINYTSNFAPFSDLNQHCIHLLPKMRSQSAGGFALTIVSPYQKSIVDSDIFIYATTDDSIREQAKEHQRDPEPIIQFYRTYAMAHEMGHLLGLDHQFTGTPSMMSYSFKTLTLTDYDRQAIQALYEPTAK